MIKLIGISRAPLFSPNSVMRDTAILQSVAKCLSKQYGCNIRLIDERFLIPSDLEDVQGAFSMGRAHETLEILSAAETKGLYMPNSAKSLLTLNRRKLRSLYQSLQINAPKGCDETNLPDDLNSLQYPCWIKRDDGCAQHQEDVQFIPTSTELANTLEIFRIRGIRHFITEEHTEGDLLKFYGVAGTDFFFSTYPTKNGYSKFGLERFNGSFKNYNFNENELREQANKLSASTGISIYGGDAIIRPSGEIVIIDFNDWPSFSACCNEAAAAIAELIYQHISQ